MEDERLEEALTLTLDLLDEARKLRNEIRIYRGLTRSQANEYLGKVKKYKEIVPEGIFKKIRGRVIDSGLKLKCEYHAKGY